LAALSVPSEFGVLLEDVQAKHVVLVAERKHGKSTSLKTFIQFVKDELGDKVLIKVFDVSQSWYHCAPVGFRQYVMRGSPGVNVGDCVFEMGRLSRVDRRGFVGEILAMDYGDRQEIKRVGGESAIKDLPLILYVFEEANTYFDSQSLNRKDDYATILGDFVSVGRNYGLGGVLVVTRMVGELAPGIRERSNLLLGRVTGAGELQALRTLTDKGFTDSVKSVKRFYWYYWSGVGLGPFRIPDLVKSAPVDYVQVVAESAPAVKKKMGVLQALGYVVLVAVVTFLFLKSVFNR
jgi:hypothetical protein